MLALFEIVCCCIVGLILGLITSSQNLAYAISKFLGGVLSDSVDSKFMFFGGLFLAGLCTLTFPGKFM